MKHKNKIITPGIECDAMVLKIRRAKFSPLKKVMCLFLADQVYSEFLPRSGIIDVWREIHKIGGDKIYRLLWPINIQLRFINRTCSPDEVKDHLKKLLESLTTKEGRDIWFDPPYKSSWETVPLPVKKIAMKRRGRIAGNAPKS